MAIRKYDIDIYQKSNGEWEKPCPQCASPIAYKLRRFLIRSLKESDLSQMFSCKQESRSHESPRL